jgi:protoheme ferro-lyase
MADDLDVLGPLMSIPANERAAALAHWIYVQSTRKGDARWQLRVAESWNNLDAKAKEFNLLTIDTWAEHPQLLEAWINAVNAYRKDRVNDQRSGT